MPFTPYHFGPVLPLGLLLRKWINIPAILIGAVIADVEGFSVLFLGVDYHVHGYAHTYLGAFSIAFILTFILYYSYSAIHQIMNFTKLKQEQSWKSIGLGAFLGTFSHVFLDSFLYTDIKPFFPIRYNPFYGLLSSSFIYNGCLVLFVIGIISYMIIVKRQK